MSNVVQEAHLGCFLVIPEGPPSSEVTLPDWCLGYDEYQVDNPDDIPDFSIDPDDGILTILNTSPSTRTYFVTVENCARVVSAQGADLLDDPLTATRREYVTFVALLHSETCMDLCFLEPKVEEVKSKSQKKKRSKNKKSHTKMSRCALDTIRVSSDIQEYIAPDMTVLESLKPYDMDVFPLLNDGRSAPTTWLCTQSSGGQLTHFAHPSTYHAVDFRCDVGTPVVAIFDGEVLEVRKDSTVTGVHVSNLFHWNSILVKKVEDELYAEYVHIHHEGVQVSVGDRIRKGEVICLSGEAGFCPEPHLHLQIQRSKDSSSPSVPILFRGSLLEAGHNYP